MKVAFDVDGVLADFGGAFNKVINLLYGKYTIPVDYKPKDWHWSDVLTPEMEKRGFQEIAKTENFWSSLKPFEEGINAVRETIINPEIDVCFLTARAPSAGSTVTKQTRGWLYNQSYLFSTKASVIAVGKPTLKRQVLEGIGIEAMIDDHGPTVEGFDQMPGFQGYLLDRPWNQDAKVKNRVATVREFCERIGCLQKQTSRKQEKSLPGKESSLTSVAL